MSESVIFSEKDIADYQNIMHTETVAETLKNKSVGIPGQGGLGSNTAIALVRAGICKFILIGFDKVELSNLNRQAYFIEHFGMYKTDAMVDLI